MRLKDRLLQFIGYTGLDIAAFERSKKRSINTRKRWSILHTSTKK
jgi:hypothetical protein